MNETRIHDNPVPVAVDAGASDPRSTSRAAPTPRPTLVVCPYCGHESTNHARCERCRGLMDPLSRQASQNAMGPWFIREESSAFRPGCSYDTLVALIAKGRVTRESIMRGPSTRQFWTRATSVPGVAHLLGECHACHTKVESGLQRCPACAAAFACSQDRQNLGLGPVRLLPGHASPEDIARSMVEAVRHSTPVGRREPVRRSAVMSATEKGKGSAPHRVLPVRHHANRWIWALVAFVVVIALAGVTVCVLAPDLMLRARSMIGI